MKSGKAMKDAPPPRPSPLAFPLLIRWKSNIIPALCDSAAVIVSLGHENSYPRLPFQPKRTMRATRAFLLFSPLALNPPPTFYCALIIGVIMILSSELRALLAPDFQSPALYRLSLLLLLIPVLFPRFFSFFVFGVSPMLPGPSLIKSTSSKLRSQWRYGYTRCFIINFERAHNDHRYTSLTYSLPFRPTMEMRAFAPRRQVRTRVLGARGRVKVVEAFSSRSVIFFTWYDLGLNFFAIILVRINPCPVFSQTLF